MTDKDQVENQDVELQENDEEISEMKHDPKNAEAQSVASVDKAGDATGTAPKRKMAGGTAADNTKKDPMPKTKAGMIAAMVHNMQKMDKKALIFCDFSILFHFFLKLLILLGFFFKITKNP